MDLREYLRILTKHWLAICVMSVLGALAGLVIAVNTPPSYRVNVAVFFSVAEGSTYNELAQGGTYSQRQVVSFAELATSPIVLTPVIKDLKLATDPRDLKKQVSANVPTDTSIVNITVTDSSAAHSADIANAIAAELRSVSFRLSPKHPSGDAMVQATITTPAVTPLAPVAPRPKVNLLIGFALGLGIGVAFGAIREILNIRVRTETDLHEICDLPVVGLLALEKGSRRERSIPILGTPQTPRRRIEAFNKLRMNLQFVDIEHKTRVITVISALPNEGKTSVAINLALSSALAGQRVLLIDADLRSPSISQELRMEGAAGLSSILIGEVDSDSLVQRWGDGTLDILPAGFMAPNPTQLLESSAMTVLLAKAREEYDLVILDAPPFLPVSDGQVLAKKSDGTLIVVASGMTKRSQLEKILDDLDKIDTRVLGIVLNKIKPRDLEFADYDYGMPSRQIEGKGAVEQKYKDHFFNKKNISREFDNSRNFMRSSVSEQDAPNETAIRLHR